MKQICNSYLLVLCVCIGVMMSTAAGCSNNKSIPATKSSIAKNSSQKTMPKPHDVLQRMIDHYAGLDTAVLTIKTTGKVIIDGKSGEEQTLGPETIYFKSPNLYGSDTENPRKLSPLSKAQVEKYGLALEDPSRYRNIIPQLFHGFAIAATYPIIKYRGEESVNGDKTDVVILKRVMEPAYGLGGSTNLTLWIDQHGKLKRFDLALISINKNPKLGFKNMNEFYRTDVTESDNVSLPSSFLSKEQTMQSANEIDRMKASEAWAVIDRMRKHYASLQTAVLTVKMSRSMGAGGEVQDQRKLNSYHVYFRSPNIYGSDIEEPHRLLPLPKSLIEEYGNALIDPAFGYLIIIPQLFQGFTIADTFPSITHKSQETLAGEITDVIVLSRELTDIPGGDDNSVNMLTLWVNGQGQLRMFELRFDSGADRPKSARGKISYYFSVEISEVDNGPLPASFTKKVK